MKIIKVTTDNIITIHDYPKGSMCEQDRAINNLIGNHCSLYECVHPVRLYREFGMSMMGAFAPACTGICMLVDEEGLSKEETAPNPIGSYLYETDRHGAPIMGNILLVGERWENEGISLCGIPEGVFETLYQRVEWFAGKVREQK